MAQIIEFTYNGYVLFNDYFGGIRFTNYFLEKISLIITKRAWALKQTHTTNTMSTINLQKGQKVDLTKTNPAVSAFKVGLGWNPNTAVGGTFDVDVSAFILGEDGKKLSDNHFVFYNNLKSPNDFVVHNGDNRTGEGDGDDETLVIDFSKVDAAAKSVVFVVTIHEAQSKNQNFGQVAGSYIRICDNATGTEIMKYDLNEDYSIETAMIFGKLYEKDRRMEV